MQKLQEYLAGAACEGAYIGLMSTPNCVPFYKSMAFWSVHVTEWGRVW